MPNRVLREGFLDSEAIHALSDAAECFFHRLLLAADDAGRMDGRVEILRARLFPLDLSRRASDVEKTLSECVKQGLVIPYEWKGQRFLQIAKWQRCSPCVTSKFPWRDGSFRIVYVKLDTRDGEKDFASTSVGSPIPSASLLDGIGPVIPPMYGDEDGNEDGNGGGRCDDETAILAAYHALLPACQKVSVLNDKRKRRIAAAVKLARKVCREQGWEYVPADFWGAYFAECAQDEWLRGDKPHPNRPSWKQNLDVLLAEDRFAGIMDRAIAAMRSAA